MEFSISGKLHILNDKIKVELLKQRDIFLFMILYKLDKELKLLIYHIQ